MNLDDPLAFYITWTLYGTHLQGDERGWRKRRKGNQLSEPSLAQWHHNRLNHSIELLDDDQRQLVETEIERFCRFRNWHLWANSARTNHVHVVVTANGYSGKTVRDQVKANCTRVLRERAERFVDRPVWTRGGDWKCINTEDDLETVVRYVNEAQDRKQFEHG